MQDGLFFRVLRRFNTLVLSLVILGAVALCGYDIWKHGFNWPHIFSQPYEEFGGPVSMPNAGTTYAVLPDYSPVNLEFPKNTGFYVLSRTSPPLVGPSGVAVGYTAPETVNLMAIGANGEGHWLFKGTKQSIIARDMVREGPAPLVQGYPTVDTRPVIAAVMWVCEDAKSVAKPVAYLWKKGATEAVKLFEMDEGVGLGQMAEDRYQIVYKKGKETRAAVYSVPDFKLISDKALPEAPK